MLGIRDTEVYQQMKRDLFNGYFVSWTIVDTPEEFSIKRTPKKCSNCGQAFYG